MRGIPPHPRGFGGLVPPRGVWGDGSPQERGGLGGSSPRGSTAVGVIVGTSGWQYRDWRGAFYPPEVPQRRWLGDYTRPIAPGENHRTLYPPPPRQTLARRREHGR